MSIPSVNNCIINFNIWSICNFGITLYLNTFQLLLQFVEFSLLLFNFNMLWLELAYLCLRGKKDIQESKKGNFLLFFMTNCHVFVISFPYLGFLSEVAWSQPTWSPPITITVSFKSCIAFLSRTFLKTKQSLLDASYVWDWWILQETLAANLLTFSSTQQPRLEALVAYQGLKNKPLLF